MTQITFSTNASFLNNHVYVIAFEDKNIPTRNTQTKYLLSISNSKLLKKINFLAGFDSFINRICKGGYKSIREDPRLDS